MRNIERHRNREWGKSGQINRRIDLEEISSRWTGEEDLSVKVALVVVFCPCDILLSIPNRRHVLERMYMEMYSMVRHGGRHGSLLKIRSQAGGRE